MKVRGRVERRDLEGGIWQLVAEDGKRYTLVGAVSGLQAGAQVEVLFDLGDGGEPLRAPACVVWSRDLGGPDEPAGVPVEDRPSWRAYATQEPFHIADLYADEKVPTRLKQGLAAQGIKVGPLAFVPLTTPHRRLGALGMSGAPGTVYSSHDISFLRLIGRVVAFAIDDNFNLRQAEAARAELERQNERLQRSERELRELIESIPEMAWTGAPFPDNSSQPISSGISRRSDSSSLTVAAPFPIIGGGIVVWRRMPRGLHWMR